VRYVKLVADQNPHILLGVNDSIKSLFKRSYPFVELTDKSKPLPDLDYYCPLGSLPLAFGTTINTIPADVPYLVTDDQLVDKWRKKINTQKLRIGIAWRGNPDNPVDVKRAMPLIELMLIADLDVALFSLKIDTKKEERLILDKNRIMSFDDIHDFDDTAAIIQNLDLIISTDTAVAHLAGALGKPVWVMLAFVADWRWHFTRTDSPWYPSASLFRQTAIGDWQGVVKNVKTNLEKWLDQHHTA
jgi:ADP-heptose:LPS heptosyltransferase